MTAHTPRARQIVHANSVSRTKIEIDDQLIRKVRKLTRLKTKREIVHDALDELVKTEKRERRSCGISAAASGWAI
jgi:Arc/MetJ family transcription regulator